MLISKSRYLSGIIQRIFFLDEIFYHFLKSRGPRASQTYANQGPHAVYLCWTWLHCSCWSLNIGAFSDYLTIKQFYLFLCLQHPHLHTPSLPNLPTILVETWEPFH